MRTCRTPLALAFSSPSPSHSPPPSRNFSLALSPPPARPKAALPILPRHARLEQRAAELDPDGLVVGDGERGAIGLDRRLPPLGRLVQRRQVDVDMVRRRLGRQLERALVMFLRLRPFAQVVH
eukprot:4994141-Pleurochrysis_carterae.AAC.1